MAAMRLTDGDVYSIEGAFWAPDLDLFRVLLTETRRRGAGDLAELGVLHGRSTVLIGDSLGKGETFTVVDVFEDPAPDEANQDENDLYGEVAQQAFEANYRRLLGDLPVVVRGLSESVVDHASHGTHRFVHVDASHLYDHVAVDIEAAHTLLRDDGVLVLDDYRAEHTPGVAAAAWAAAANIGLHPFALSPQKMYATWGDPSGYLDVVTRWASGVGLLVETQHVLGGSLVRVAAPPPPRGHPLRRLLPEAAGPAVDWLRDRRDGIRVRTGRPSA